MIKLAVTKLRIAPSFYLILSHLWHKFILFEHSDVKILRPHQELWVQQQQQPALFICHQMTTTVTSGQFVL